MAQAEASTRRDYARMSDAELTAHVEALQRNHDAILFRMTVANAERKQMMTERKEIERAYLAYLQRFSDRKSLASQMCTVFKQTKQVVGSMNREHMVNALTSYLNENRQPALEHVRHDIVSRAWASEMVDRAYATLPKSAPRDFIVCRKRKETASRSQPAKRIKTASALPPPRPPQPQ
jgi:hypothetical protein